MASRVKRRPTTSGVKTAVMCGQRARASGELVLALVLALSRAQDVCADNCGSLRCPRAVLLYRDRRLSMSLAYVPWLGLYLKCVPVSTRV